MAKTTTQANTTTAVAAPYEPKPQERLMLEAARERRRARPPSPRFKLEQTGRATALALDHPDLSTGSLLLMEALGTASMDFVNPFVNQLASVASPGQEPDEDGQRPSRAFNRLPGRRSTVPAPRPGLAGFRGQLQGALPLLAGARRRRSAP